MFKLACTQHRNSSIISMFCLFLILHHEGYAYVVRIKKDSSWKMGWQYTTPSGNIIFPQKRGAKGVLKFRTPYFVRILHPRFQLVCHEMRRTPMEQTTSPSLLCQTKGCPETGHPFAYYLWIWLHSSLLSEYFFFHSSNSFCPSSLAYSFRISGTRNRAKESTMDCGSSMSYCSWCFFWLAMVTYSHGKTFLAQLSSVHTPFQPCTDTDLQPAAQQGDKPFVDLQTFS